MEKKSKGKSNKARKGETYKEKRTKMSPLLRVGIIILCDGQ